MLILSTFAKKSKPSYRHTLVWRKVRTLKSSIADNARHYAFWRDRTSATESMYS